MLAHGFGKVRMVCDLGRNHAPVFSAGRRKIPAGRGCYSFGLSIAALALAMMVARSFPETPSHSETVTQGNFFALRLTTNSGTGTRQKILDRYGVPFIAGTLALSSNGPAQVEVEGRLKRIFLLGMTDATRGRAWSHPLDYPARYFIGEEMGKIRLNYADGSSEVFPLVVGEAIWWGQEFYQYPEPFTSNARFRKALAGALRLYPPSPVADGKYVAVIVPRPTPVRSISVEAAALDRGIPVIAGITVESMDGNDIAGAVALPGHVLSAEFEKFAERKALLPEREDDKQRQAWLDSDIQLGRDCALAQSAPRSAAQSGRETHVEHARSARCHAGGDAASAAYLPASSQARLDELRRMLYTSDENFKGRVKEETPAGYSGPEVSFKGNIYAEILANAFRYNVGDLTEKVTKDGKYHTSTKGSTSWGGYRGFGTFRTNAGNYYNTSWCRDMGRSLQELTELGYTSEAARCADYCFEMARRWETDPRLKIAGTVIPRHWCRVINTPGKEGCFENDGHGLVAVFLYKLWQRLPDRDAWLRERWPDVKAAGDWILWQFDHPEISRATNGVLHTTSECAVMDGYSVYADAVCRDALLGLAQMAESIGATNSAAQWRERAEKMRLAITSQYVISDPKYGPVWTLDYAGWPQQSTVLGPLIFVADQQGFAPEDDDSRWRPVNEAAYQRLIDTHQPLGFYGQAMGYGQGFITQSALLLDRMQDATTLLNWMAKEIYDPKYKSYITPEGCEIDPTGHYWYRMGDLGNGVQEAETLKTLRLMIGVDDTQPDRLQFFPRMPYGWSEMAVKSYPVLFEHDGKMNTARLRYKLNRSGNEMKLEIGANQDLGPVAMRLGPFAKPPSASGIRVNGRIQTGSIERSGDSWWVGVKVAAVGP